LAASFQSPWSSEFLVRAAEGDITKVMSSGIPVEQSPDADDDSEPDFFVLSLIVSLVLSVLLIITVVIPYLSGS
jgi:hypothetical protein